MHLQNKEVCAVSAGYPSGRWVVRLRLRRIFSEGEAIPMLVDCFVISFLAMTTLQRT